MEKRIFLTEINLEEAAASAARVLSAGGVVLFPTDTVYSLAADSLRRSSLEKIYRIKGREEGKPIHSVVASLADTAQYAEVTPLAEVLAGAFLPGPLTLLLQKRNNVPAWAVANKDTFGVRVPDNAFCLALARAFGKPFTATSANVSGKPPHYSASKALEEFGPATREIDLVIDAGQLPERSVSTVVDARGNEPLIVREGAISAAEITKALHA